MSKEPLEFLKHIADECTYLLSVNKDLSKDDFLDDETLKRAVVRSLTTKSLSNLIYCTNKSFIFYFSKYI
jgi:hypothetical protein